MGRSRTQEKKETGSIVGLAVALLGTLILPCCIYPSAYLVLSDRPLIRARTWFLLQCLAQEIV